MPKYENSPNQPVNNSQAMLSEESPWHMFSILRQMDRFGQPIPAFNIKGKNQINTVSGGIMSAIILMVTFGYFLIGLQSLIVGTNRVINYNVVHSHYGIEQGLNMKEKNLRIAIAILGNYDWLMKYDRKYVRLVADYYNDLEN